MLNENQIQNLVKQSQAGQSEAFGALYDEFASRIFNFLIMRLKHKQTAEDLLHTTFLKAWRNIGTYTQKSAKFSTWLFQIANYTLIDYWRTKKDTSDLDKIENLSEFSTDHKLFETYDYLWDALKELPDDQQTVIELRFRQDLSITEAAMIMNRSAVSIRVLQHRALKNLNKVLSRQGLLPQ